MGSKKMMNIIIALLIVLIGGVAGLGFMMFKNMSSDNSKPTIAQSINKNVDIKDIKTVKISEPITTNLADSIGGNKNHMIQLDFSIGVYTLDKKASKDLIKEIGEKEAVIQHAVIEIISTRTYEEMKDSDSKKILVNELVERLQAEFKTNLIVDIYLKDWKLV